MTSSSASESLLIPSQNCSWQGSTTRLSTIRFPKSGPKSKISLLRSPLPLATKMRFWYLRKLTQHLPQIGPQLETRSLRCYLWTMKVTNSSTRWSGAKLTGHIARPRFLEQSSSWLANPTPLFSSGPLHSPKRHTLLSLPIFRIPWKRHSWGAWFSSLTLFTLSDYCLLCIL